MVGNYFDPGMLAKNSFRGHSISRGRSPIEFKQVWFALGNHKENNTARKNVLREYETG
jgi:hypothetical protein